jgi:hypothetical protein
MAQQIDPRSALPTPTAYRQAALTNPNAGYLDGPLTFRLPVDLRMACIDQAQAMGMPFDVWLQGTIEEALRAQLGV